MSILSSLKEKDITDMAAGLKCRSQATGQTTGHRSGHRSDHRSHKNNRTLDKTVLD